MFAYVFSWVYYLYTIWHILYIVSPRSFQVAVPQEQIKVKRVPWPKKFGKGCCRDLLLGVRKSNYRSWKSASSTPHACRAVCMPNLLSVSLFLRFVLVSFNQLNESFLISSKRKFKLNEFKWLVSKYYRFVLIRIMELWINISVYCIQHNGLIFLPMHRKIYSPFPEKLSSERTLELNSNRRLAEHRRQRGRLNQQKNPSEYFIIVFE